MKFVFVRFMEQGFSKAQVVLARGERAESQAEFIRSHISGGRIRITTWFEVPEDWVGLAAALGHDTNKIFGALIALDGLCEHPFISWLLAKIFEAGFECGRASEK